MLHVESTESAAERLRLRLARTMARTIADFGLIEEGDRILVGLSGGKDSSTLFDLLARLRGRAPIAFEIVGVHLDQGQPGYDGAPLVRWLEASGERFEILAENTYEAVIADAAQEEERGKRATYCRVCSRLRRGILYTAAERLGCNKLALGHHRDDALETLLLNLFYSGRLQAMPASYVTNDGRFRVLRPLIECAEADIAEHARAAAYPILPCNLCGSQDDLKRAEIKRLLAELERRIPDVRSVMLAALKNVRPSHLLDREVAEAWEGAAGRYAPRR